MQEGQRDFWRELDLVDACDARCKRPFDSALVVSVGRDSVQLNDALILIQKLPRETRPQIRLETEYGTVEGEIDVGFRRLESLRYLPPHCVGVNDKNMVVALSCPRCSDRSTPPCELVAVFRIYQPMVWNAVNRELSFGFPASPVPKPRPVTTCTYVGTRGTRVLRVHVPVDGRRSVALLYGERTRPTLKEHRNLPIVELSIRYVNAGRRYVSRLHTRLGEPGLDDKVVCAVPYAIRVHGFTVGTYAVHQLRPLLNWVHDTVTAALE